MAPKSLPPPRKLCPNILLNLSGQHGEPSFVFSSLPDNTSFLYIIAPLRCDLFSHSSSSPHIHSTRHDDLQLIPATPLSSFLPVLTSVLDHPASFATIAHAFPSLFFMILSLLVSPRCLVSPSLFCRSLSPFTSSGPPSGYSFYPTFRNCPF